MHELGKIEDWRVPVKTRLDGEHLWVKFMVANREPYRPNINDWIARIPLGKRLIFRTNNKSDGDHDRWYFEDNFQLGFAATATLDLPLFREIDERVLLY